MESDIETTPAGPGAASVLDDLERDRRTLAERIRPPRWYYVAFGAVAGAFVATAAVPEGPARTTAFVVTVALYAALVATYPRLTGVRARRVGGRTIGLLAIALAVTLLLYSVALDLAVSLSPWWVALPALACVAVIVTIGLATEGARRRTLSHVR